MRDRFIAILTVLSKPAVALGGAVLIGGGALGYAYYATSVNPSGSYTAATVGPITEEVDVTGTVKAAHATDLGFQAAGRIAAIHVQVGDHVGAGETLAVLDGGAASAALAGATANLEMQQAKLASLQAGTRPEQLAVDQTAAAQADLALQNAVQSAYVYADDAVHVKADQAFLNPRTGNAQLAPQVSDANLVNKVQQERNALEPMLVSWQGSLSATSSNATTSVVSVEANLKTVGVFLDDLARALAETAPGGATNATTLAAYQSAVNAARVNVSTALTAVTSAETGQKSAAGALALAEAGATSQDIAAQQASVDSAQAAVSSAQVALNYTAIIAPVSGTITAQNAELGETVAPGSPLISMIADGKFQADAQVSENDIGKIEAGDAVVASFDAYPGAIFPATVTTVPPAATVSAGVSSYTLTVTFADNDPRIRAGLSANLRIIAATKDNVLSVPSSAIITSGDQKFVYVQGAKGPVKTLVRTGIVSANGSAEILSGLSEGERVLTFGSSAE